MCWLLLNPSAPTLKPQACLHAACAWHFGPCVPPTSTYCLVCIQVRGTRESELHAAALEHIRTSSDHPLCGRIIGADGNAAAVRSRCSCIRPVTHEMQKQILSDKVLFETKFCQETPARNDPLGLGRCSQCIKRGCTDVPQSEFTIGSGLHLSLICQLVVVVQSCVCVASPAAAHC